jgi:hypothetical protein
VLQPTGLAIQGKTTSSLTIDWSGPATGPLPGKYEILRDGTVIGTVPGTATHYTDSGLAPDSPYQYQVIAVRGGQQSPISRSLTGQTSAPQYRFDITGASRYSCSGEGSIRSASSTSEVLITFVNDTTADLKIIWLSFSGSSELYVTLPPGSEAGQLTYKGHYWLIASSAGKCLGIFGINGPGQIAAKSV